jgi:hypothetical protein
MSDAGRVDQEMIVNKRKNALPQSEANLKKEQRARESTKAMLEHEAEARAIRERTARLRELRLAKESAEKSQEVGAEPEKPASQRRRSVRSMH